MKDSVPCWLLARGHTQFLAMWASVVWQLASSKAEREREKEREREFEGKTEAIVFCNLIMEGISHHFCTILFIGNESLGPATHKE